MKQTAETTYYYAEAGSDVYGPLPLATLRVAQAAGKLSAGALISRQQTGPWAELATYAAPAAPLGKAKAPRAKDHANYLAYTAVSVLIPILGLLLGVVCMVRQEPQDRKLGEHLMAVAILFMIVYYFGYQMWWASNHVPVR